MSRIARGFPIWPLHADRPLPASTAITGTATATIDEADVVAGTKTVIIDLIGDTWVSGAAFTNARQGIIDGLDSAQGTTFGWNNEVRDKEVVTAVVRTSSTKVTIILTAAGDYDISSTETITVTVPSAALSAGILDVTGSPTFTVNAVGGSIAPQAAYLTRLKSQ